MNTAPPCPYPIRFLRSALAGAVGFFALLWATPVRAAVVINEIHYHPKDKASPSEFIELFNTGPAEAVLTGWKFDDGVKYTFPADTKIAPGGFLVVAKSLDGFKAAFGKEALGPWKGN